MIQDDQLKYPSIFYKIKFLLVAREVKFFDFLDMAYFLLHNYKIYNIFCSNRQRNLCIDLNEPLLFEEFGLPSIYGQSAHEGGKFVSPTHRLPARPSRYSWYSFLLKAESNPGQFCG
jgi:hypothetical protein